MNDYKVGDVVVYGVEGLCRISDITEKKFGKEAIKYYVLQQIGKADSVIYVPLNNDRSLSKMRHILTKQEILEALRLMPAETEPWVENERERQKEFKETILYGESKDLLSLTRSLYLHKEEQVDKGKKLHIADERVFKDAEKIIYEEIAYVFGIKPEEVLDFIKSNIPQNDR